MQFVKFKPVSLRGGRGMKTECPIYLAAANKCSKRTTERYVINLKQFFRETKFGWKNVAVGMLNNEVFFCEGDVTDYVVSKHNNELANKLLIEKLLDLYNVRKPLGADTVKIKFNYVKFENMYKLVKI